MDIQTKYAIKKRNEIIQKIVESSHINSSGLDGYVYWQRPMSRYESDVLDDMYLLYDIDTTYLPSFLRRVSTDPHSLSDEAISSSHPLMSYSKYVRSLSDYERR